MPETNRIDPRSSRIFDGHFTGKHVLVTGAATGIGLGIASAFATAGATVRMVDLSDEVGNAAEELSSGGLDVSADVLDVTDESAVQELFRSVGREFAKLDVLVNNAGIITIDPLAETTLKSFERVLRVNTTAQFLAAREAAGLMDAAGGGSILNAASGQARQGFIYTPGYAASKFGVMGSLSRCPRS